MKNVYRNLTINRKRSISGSVVRYNIYLDGKKVGRIGNGETFKIPIGPERAVLELDSDLPMMAKPKPILIDDGFFDVEVKFYIKIKNPLGLKQEWCLDLVSNLDEREMGKQMISNFALVSCSDIPASSMVSKMEEFRYAGRKLQVSYIFRAQDMLITGTDLVTGASVGEPITVAYQEITGMNRKTLVHTLPAPDRLDVAKQVEQMINAGKIGEELEASRYEHAVCICLK